MDEPALEAAPYSSYDTAGHGPSPVPDWLITSFSARDTTLGLLKTGKEADVSLLDRSLPGGPGCLLAVKTYRDSHHRMFHRDSGYQEGRRTRRSRESRAMAARTTFGRDLLSAKWAGAEFTVLSTLWTAGAKVPYPVQILGSELMMEFIGGPDGAAAPRLAAYQGDSEEFTSLWHDLVQSLETLAQLGLTHGDLSPYNVLVHEGGCVVIDLPQAVDVVANPQGESFLQRDCRVIAEFFARRGVLAADGELLALHLGGIARG
ncbi:RIO1 family regulatory kinase/ATPase [Nakamurella sp. UYEF19]|uniref:serine protein kinase RIO n=1 Tax=Nakamurella sp. UYEF19 TaxID=1756392 RepID=UPI0033977C51